MYKTYDIKLFIININFEFNLNIFIYKKFELIKK